MDENNFGPDIFTFSDENGNEVELELLDTVEMDGKLYYALCEADIPDDENTAIEVIILRVDENEDGTEDLVEPDDDAELERVYDKFLFQQEDDE